MPLVLTKYLGAAIQNSRPQFSDTSDCFKAITIYPAFGTFINNSLPLTSVLLLILFYTGLNMELLKQARIILSLAAITLTNQTLAEQRIDYDIDDDGLIEINTLEDLNQIRNEFDTATRLIKGTHLYGKNDGCPVTEERNGCHGYELTSDLSFDTNNNGQFDEGDSFWNDGKGFAPFGQYSPKFGAEFHGNGFTIRHLYMNYPDQRFVGLFSYNEMSYIHDLTLQAEIICGMHSV